MIPVRIRDKTYQLPTGWHEVSAQQYIELSKIKTQEEMISVLLDLDQSIFRKAQSNLALSVIQSLSFVNDNFDVSAWPIPPTVNIANRTIQPTTTPEQMTWGQREDSVKYLAAYQQHEEKPPNLFYDYLVRIAAIYLQPTEKDGTDYDIEQAEYYYQQLLTMPANTVLPIGFFFHHTLHVSPNTSPIGWRRSLTRRLTEWRKRRLQKAYNRYHRSLLLTLWPEETQPSTTKY